MIRSILVLALTTLTSVAFAADPGSKLGPEPLSPHDYILSLHASRSGPGILVCEPVPSTKADPRLVDFAAGASYWMRWTIGGEASFGRTPMPYEIDRTRFWVMHRPNLRFTRTDVPLLEKMFGGIYIVTSTVTGTVADGTVTYTIWNPDGSTVGPPYTVAGTPDDMRKGLLNTAQIIVERIGSTDLPQPDQLTATADDLTLIGSTLADWDKDLSFEQIGKLHKLSATVPAATLILADHDIDDPSILDTLRSQANGNAAMLAEIAGRRSDKDTAAAVDAAVGNAPNNYQLLRSKEDETDRSDLDARRKVMEAAVSASPLSPWAWSVLGGIVRDQAGNVRNGRFYDDLSQEESAYLDSKYALDMALQRHAIDLAPMHALVYVDLAKTYTFAGDNRAADAAMQKSLKLDIHDRTPFLWALQMYQPKWGGDPNRLLAAAKAFESDSCFHDSYDKIIDAIADNEDPAVKAYRLQVFGKVVQHYMGQSAYSDWKHALATKDSVKPLYAITRRIRNEAIHIQAGRFFGKLTSTEQAADTALMRTAHYAAVLVVMRDPRFSNGWLNVAWTQDPEMSGAVMTAISTDPNNHNAYLSALNLLQPKWYGDPATFVQAVKKLMEKPALMRDLSPMALLSVQANLDGAKYAGDFGQKYAKQADALKALQPPLQKAFDVLVASPSKSPEALQALGMYYDAKSDTPNALAAYRDCVKLDPKNAQAEYLFAIDLHRANDIDGAIAHYTTSYKLDPTNSGCAINLIGLLQYRNRNAEALKVANELTKNAPLRAQGFLLLGNILAAEGKQEAALSAWKTAGRLDHYDADGGHEARMKLIDYAYSTAH